LKSEENIICTIRLVTYKIIAHHNKDGGLEWDVSAWMSGMQKCSHKDRSLTKTNFQMERTRYHEAWQIEYIIDRNFTFRKI